MESDTNLHVKIDNDSRHAVTGQGRITFHLESGGSLDSHNAIYIPYLKKNLISLSAMEENDFSITFQ
jgi:hypothetical protein